MSGFFGSYENETWSNSTRPFGSRSSSGTSSSSVSSGASSSSKTRSADAIPDCITLIIDASWVSGWVNCREYWMNAWMPPMVSWPEETIRPPMRAIAT